MIDPTETPSHTQTQNGNQIWTRATMERMEIDDLDRMAYGLVGGQIFELAPDRIAIKWHDDLENPKHKFAVGGMGWVRSVDFSDPIEVSVAQDGTLHLEDGHHRWFAAGKLGRNLRAIIEIKGKPIERILQMQTNDKG